MKMDCLTRCSVRTYQRMWFGVTTRAALPHLVRISNDQQRNRRLRLQSSDILTRPEF
jgi:hypothetical protein